MMKEDTEMQSFGAVVHHLRAPTTVSSMLSTKPRVITAPTTDAECNSLRMWAVNTPMEREPAATPEQLNKHLSFMASALPAKGVDDLTGKMRFAVYSSLLAGYSNEALAYMARTACQTLNWFPTPKQCLDLVAEYRAPEPPQSVALRLCQDYTSNKFDRWLENIRAGQPLGDVPEQWLRIAVERGAVRRLANGSFVSRALYHGPCKPYAEQRSAAA